VAAWGLLLVLSPGSLGGFAFFGSAGVVHWIVLDFVAADFAARVHAGGISDHVPGIGFGVCAGCPCLVDLGRAKN
jgi:hypothetical protein